MAEFILLMHDDTKAEPSTELWSSYLSFLRLRGVFEGGSSIGAGDTFRKEAIPGGTSKHLTGYIRIAAESLKEAGEFLSGNPVFECGGTVEIRELTRE
jgi:hypothetical protein